MVLLKVVIGIVFVMLLLSLLATSIMELLASFLSLRGKNLNKALRNMLASSDTHEKVFNKFQENALFRQLSANPAKGGGEPSYMKDKTFQSILFDVILQGESLEKIEEKIEQLPDADLKNVLWQLYRNARGDYATFQQNVQDWYNNVMDRASGWYKRRTQRILLYLGFAIAIIFNADVLSIYNRLESDPEKLNQVVQLANSFVLRYGDSAIGPQPFNDTSGDRIQPYFPENTLSPPREPVSPEPTGGYNSSPGSSNGNTTQDVDSANQTMQGWLAGKERQEGQITDPQTIREIQQMILQELKSAESPLGLGWALDNPATFNFQDWILKILGWTVTALAITLGAPFWFDLLKRLVNIRGSGREQ